MAEDLVTRLRKFWGDVTNRDILEAAEEIERLSAENARLREALQDIFDYECRTSSTSLIACTARDALWPLAARAEKEEK